MAEGFAKQMAPGYEIYSAGVKPEKHVGLFSMMAMKSLGADISQHQPTHINQFQNQKFDKVICFGKDAYVMAFKMFSEDDVEFYDVADPWGTKGNEVEVLNVYLNTANQIRKIVAQVIYCE